MIYKINLDVKAFPYGVVFLRTVFLNGTTL